MPGNRVDADALFAVLGGRILRHAQQPVLGGGVGSVLQDRDVAVNRGHVDDGAPRGIILGQELLDLVVHAVDHAIEVQLDRPVPLVQIHLTDPGARAVDSGAVERQVQCTIGLHGLLHGALVILAGRGVHLKRDCLSARVGDDLGSLFSSLKVDIRSDDLDSVAGEFLCGVFTQPGARSGDDGHLAVEPSLVLNHSHVVAP